MSTVQRIAKNTGVLLISQIVSYTLSFFFVMYTARYLGAEGFGILSFALAFTGIFGVLADFGLSTLTVREVARDKSLSEKYLGNIAVMKILLVAITFGLIVLTINILGYPEQTIKVVYFIALSILFSTFSSAFYSIIQAYEEMGYVAIGYILNSSLMLGGALFAISREWSVIGFSSLYFFISAIILCYSAIICTYKFAFPKMELDWSFWKQCIKETWPLGVMGICNIIRLRIDTVMLSLMIGDIAVGLYNAAYRLVDISVIIPSMFMASVLPVLSQYYKNSAGSFNAAYEKSFKYLLAIALPLAFGVTLLAKPIINLIYGPEFSKSAAALQVLIWAVASMYVSILVGAMYVTADKQRLSMKLTLVTVNFTIILNLLLIPRYSYLGAAATTVASEVFGLLLGIFFLGKYGHKLSITRTCLAPFLGLAGSGTLAIFLTMYGINIYVTAVITILLYGVLIYRLGIGDDDKQLIRNILNLTPAKASTRKVP